MAIVNIGSPTHTHAGKTSLTARLRYAAGASDGSPSNNLIDAPGHPAFLAEVERVLRMPARALMRASQRPRPPNLLFVNKEPPNSKEYPPPDARRA